MARKLRLCVYKVVLQVVVLLSVVYDAVESGVARAQVSTTTQMQQRTTQAQNERIDGKQEAASGVEPGAMVAVGGRGRIEVCTRWLFC